MLKHLHRIDWVSVGLGALAGMQVAFISLGGMPRWQTTPDAVLVAVLGFTVGHRLCLRRFQRMVVEPMEEFTTALGRMPKSITLNRDEDGASALIERVNADPVVIRIPEEIAEQGPQAAVEWAAEQATRGD